MGGGLTIAQQEAFFACERIARAADENFSVVTRIVPKHLRPHFASIYAFARGVDELGDAYAGDRMQALAEWERQLHLCYDGAPTVDVFVALQVSVRAFGLARDDFLKLIEANRMDQRGLRYKTMEDLKMYCRHSADPVGHLVLALFGFVDSPRQAMSDDTCTGLQIANFLQDLERDSLAGRCYIPEEILAQEGLTPSDLPARRGDARIQAVVRCMAHSTEQLFASGARLEAIVPYRLRLQLRMYRMGGEAVLEALRAQAFDPFAGRPRISRAKKFSIALAACVPQAGLAREASDDV
ncbi:MAG: squalene synthase HpnC [Firmicutes bacterium]|nr:squalene synthase HpnC [Bacillota bacterium]